MFTLLLLLLLSGCHREHSPHELKVASILPPDHPTSHALRFFQETLEERSEGAIKIRLFSGSQLGNANDSIELARGGNIEVVQCSAVHLSPFRPLFNALGLPFLFRNREHRLNALDGDLADPLRETLAEMDLILLAVLDAGSRNLMTKTGPITEPNELSGLKIRVMPSQTMVDSINALGATAVAMNQGDVYTALQTGVLDGWENNPPTTLNFRMYETGCTHFAWSRHLAVPDFLLMSQSAYLKLPEHLRAVVMEVADETQRLQRDLWIAAETDAIESLQIQGMEFNDVNQQAFASQVEELYRQTYEQFGPDFAAYAEALKAHP
ncbi:MAG: TRAP transporter substrate-binding protein DctP [Puniceicoccales bacterium]